MNIDMCISMFCALIIIFCAIVTVVVVVINIYIYIYKKIYSYIDYKDYIANYSDYVMYKIEEAKKINNMDCRLCKHYDGYRCEVFNGKISEGTFLQSVLKCINNGGIYFQLDTNKAVDNNKK